MQNPTNKTAPIVQATIDAAPAAKAANKAASATPAPVKPKRVAAGKPAPTSGAKPKRKPAAPATAPATDTDKPKAVHFHIDAGLKSRVARLTNANRAARVLTNRVKAPGDLTDDKKRALYDLRAFYSKPFPARGLDNGILRDLLAAKLISLSGGTDATFSGKPYKIDGEKPLTVTITKAGRAYGKTA